MVFTRDLRVHDNPALATAVARARQVVPLFVVDPALAVPPNRARFLADSLKALRSGLRDRGGDLVIRRGDPVAEVITLATRTGAGSAPVTCRAPGRVPPDRRTALLAGGERAALDRAPWRLPEARRRQLRYPPPLIDVNISPA